MINSMINKKEIQEKIDYGYSLVKLSRHFLTNVYRIKKYLEDNNLKTIGKTKRKTKNKQTIWSFEELSKAVSISRNKSEILKNLGVTPKPNTYMHLKKDCQIYGIDISNLVYYPGKFTDSLKSLEEVFVENSKTSRICVKSKIIKHNLIEYKCVIWKNSGLWKEEKLILHLDHINGINNDNRLENLRFLCPNCHSQTNTFSSHKKTNNCESCNNLIGINSKKCKKCAKHKKEKDMKYNKEILIQQIKQYGFVGTGKIYNVSDNAIRWAVERFKLDPKTIKKQRGNSTDGQLAPA